MAATLGQMMDLCISPCRAWHRRIQPAPACFPVNIATKTFRQMSVVWLPSCARSTRLHQRSRDQATPAEMSRHPAAVVLHLTAPHMRAYPVCLSVCSGAASWSTTDSAPIHTPIIYDCRLYAFIHASIRAQHCLQHNVAVYNLHYEI